MDSLVPLLLDPKFLAVAAGVAVTVAVSLYVNLSKHSAELKARRLGTISTFGHIAYLAVSEVTRRTPNTYDDKFALFLRYCNEALESSGHKPLSGPEVDIASQLANGLHFQEKRAETLASLSAPVIASPVTIEGEGSPN